MHVGVERWNILISRSATVVRAPVKKVGFLPIQFEQIKRPLAVIHLTSSCLRFCASNRHSLQMRKVCYWRVQP